MIFGHHKNDYYSIKGYSSGEKETSLKTINQVMYKGIYSNPIKLVVVFNPYLSLNSANSVLSDSALYLFPYLLNFMIDSL